MTTPRNARRNEPLADRLLRKLDAAKTEHRWPSRRWRDDPIGFFYEVLCVPYLTPEQQLILQALNKPRARVSVSSGHKTGKDFLAGGIALWWWTGDEEARVRATAVTIMQVRDVFWMELVRHHQRSHYHLDKATQRLVPSPYPLDGRPNKQPGNGLKVGLREVVGFTADQQEGAAGISGRRVLYIYDEASGIDDSIFETGAGNLAGGDARVLMLSQPTRNAGYFYDSHHEKSDLWQCFTLSSLDSPNVIEGRDLVPGLATSEWIEEQKIDWNAPHGPRWKMRVLGQFAEGGDMLVIQMAVVRAAEKLWAEMPTPDDRLCVGFDPAGTGADENAAAPRRGMKILEVEAWLTPELTSVSAQAKANAARLMTIVRRHRKPREAKALIVMDFGGTVAQAVYTELLRYAEEIEIATVQFGAKSPLWREYQCMRDHLWFGFAEKWLGEGGALPPDRKLPAELTAPAWFYDEQGRRHVEKKVHLRERLGRSTDRADACLLSVYAPWGSRAGDGDDAAVPPPQWDVNSGAISPFDGAITPWGDP